jgi:hypothetical protein
MQALNTRGVQVQIRACARFPFPRTTERFVHLEFEKNDQRYRLPPPHIICHHGIQPWLLQARTRRDSAGRIFNRTAGKGSICPRAIVTAEMEAANATDGIIRLYDTSNGGRF